MTRFLHLYVHVPFCARRCPYCHFYNLRHDDAREAVYLDALSREIERWRASGAFAEGEVSTVYFGGGTPSLLSPAGFSRLAGLCRGIAPGARESEWTVEANPDDVTPERLARWRSAGANRLSIGVQSFDEERLSFLGRIHSGEDAREAVLLAVEGGFEDVSIDLMFNLEVPGRRRAWSRDLRTALSLPISHLSLYGLTIEPGTAFAFRDARGSELTLADGAYAAEYRAACRSARRAGFEHYEVSSFAVPGRRARHNAAYWSGAPYLGLGPAAHSFDGIRRWANVASITAWADALAIGDDPREFVEELGEEERDLETLYLGLRTREGVPADHPLLARERGREIVAALVEEEALRDHDGRIGCTEKGFLLLDAILERLVRSELARAAPSSRRD